MVTLCDSCEVRTESRFHFVVVTLCDSCEVRTESRFNFVMVTLCDSCEVRTESSFHFVVVTLRDSCEVRTEFICYAKESRPPLWSSGQSSWLQSLRSWFDSRRYQISSEVVGLERDPLSLVSAIEERLGKIN
jgi:hypothetical protein